MPEQLIAYQCIVPVRKSAAESSEQVSQLLFGERATVLDQDRHWRRIRGSTDGYEGWVDRKMMLSLESGWLDAVSHWEYVHAHALMAHVGMHGQEAPQPLTLGCLVPIPQDQEDGLEVDLRLGAYRLRVPRHGLRPVQPNTVEGRIRASEAYLGAPYLWGGRTVWGIDCSGFMQAIFGQTGITLPRDAYQQAEAPGKEISFGDHAAGDLAFFSNDAGRVIHVGMLLDGQQIRHASGHVHDAWFRKEGIFSKSTQLQTHKLCSIRRFH